MKTRALSGFLLLLLLSAHPNNALSQWQQIPSLSGLFVTCMVTTEDSTILVGGLMGTLLRSTDNGAFWTSVWGNGIFVDTILSLGAGHGYIFAGADGVNNLFRSSDDGLTWNLSNTGLSSWRIYSFAYADTILYAAGITGMFSSANHGESWMIDTAGLGNNSLMPWLNSTKLVTFTGDKLYTVKEWTEEVYRSRPDTIFWTSIGLRQWQTSLAGIDTCVFAATYYGVFMYSGSDTTWTKRSDGLPEYMWTPIITAVDSVLFLYEGTYYGIYVSGDLGLHWEPLESAELGGAAIQSMSSTETHVIAETGVNGWRLAARDVVLSAEDEHASLPLHFGLKQNYPNPFNPGTVISYQQSVISNVKLSVIDMLGREIAVLVNEEKRPGEYTLTWNAGDLPSGVYFVRLQSVSGIQTKKMVLMK